MIFNNILAKKQKFTVLISSFRSRIVRGHTSVVGIAVAMVIVCAQSIAAAGHFGMLQARLIRDGFNPDYVGKIYESPHAVFDLDTATYYFLQKESEMNYAQFLEDSAIKKAAHYLEEFNGIFTEVEKRYAVPKEIIAAILLVETRLGTVTGHKSIVNTLSTLSALGDHRNKKYFLSAFKKEHEEISPKQIDKWIKRKSAWAYRELKAYLTYAARNNIDPFALRGSYAGAFGFAQFLPSNVLRYGRDGNGDGTIDLFRHPDAIESIACFLKGHGWRPSMSDKKTKKVLFAYNRSTYYVNTILSVADKVKGELISSVSE